MIAVFVLTIALNGVEVIDFGKPVYRNPGISEESTIPKRIGWGDFTQEQVADPSLVGFAATEDCGYIGERVGITWPDGPAYPYLVIDCRERHLEPEPGAWGFGVEVEMDEWLAHYDWGLWVDRVPVTVWQLATGPPRGPF